MINRDRDYAARDFIRDDEGLFIVSVVTGAGFLLLVLPVLVLMMALAFWPVFKLIEMIY